VTDYNQLQATRAQKRDAILALQSAVVAVNIEDFIAETEPIASLRDYAENLTIEDLDEEDYDTGVVGRIMSIRVQGKIAFLDVVDEGGRIQLFIRKVAGVETDDVWSTVLLLDIGDFIGVTGRLMRTRAKELSIGVSNLTFFSKAVSPLPDKHWGLTDIEIRQRQRYLDLIMNPEVMKTFQTRARVIQSVRQFMEVHGFMEVETPMFHPVSGGANARPFTTHHNALDTDFNLRIAPELYLKRLIVGGFRRVYELNRNFRNEGIDRTHNPEFTMLECYEAYATYRTAMDTVERLIQCVAEDLNYEGGNMSPWYRHSLRDLVAAHLGRPAESDEELMRVFETEIESTLILPTIVYDFPVSVSPLAKAKPDEPGIAERFEVYIGGMEIANAFSELTDPEEQLRRFEAQVASHADESREVDYDYIRALSYGMPPTAGLGMGIDRLVMLFTGQASIREVILFPSMRKEA
jgi:lysyl-tRNA synthetase class 2